MSIIQRTSYTTVAVFASVTWGQPSFQGLGDLPGGEFTSRAEAVSGDGSVVVGYSIGDSGMEQAFRWTFTDGWQALGDLPGGAVRSAALGVSHDGAVIVGKSVSGTYPAEAVRWTNDGGIVSFAQVIPLPSGRLVMPCGSGAVDVSDDGQVILGWWSESWSICNQPGFFNHRGEYGFRLVLPSQWLEGPGWIELSTNSNGTVIVGGEGQPYRYLFLPNGSTSVEPLGSHPGLAHDVTPDGSVVVGWARFGSTKFAFRWMASRPPLERMERLSDPSAAWAESVAMHVSSGGSIVVGSGKATGANGDEAFVWDDSHGMRSLRDVLEHDFCLDLAGWTLTTATGVSDDGLTIVGYGTKPSVSPAAWIARITSLAETDLDRDGTPNCADGCPNDPFKTEPGICGCNVSDVDMDTDGLLDCLDNCPNHANPEQRDCDGNGTGDVCALATGLSPDCNFNLRPDDCDIDSGTSLDRNGNAVPDECDVDCNENDTPDDIDIVEGASFDCNENAVPDECDVFNFTSTDCNVNAVPDECEIAAIHNCCQVGHGTGCNAPEIAACVCGFDSFCCLTDWDRTCTGRVSDGTCGTCEMVNDCNSNAVPDECEPDCNGNEVADDCDIEDTLSFDCQRNGVPDECESDFDTDGKIDDCDPDIDEDGILNKSDECVFTPLENPINADGRPMGDLNDDCLVTLADHQYFAICIGISGPGHIPAFADCIEAFDFEGDGDVDLHDYSKFEQSVVLPAVSGLNLRSP